jgi:ataxia telangiectasia mutated family protein
MYSRRSYDDCTELILFHSVVLSDKSYHKIFEVIFKASLTEKRNFLTAKKTTLTATLTRLSLCADVVRAVVKATATKLKVKTLEAVIDHLTQTLPMADGGFCAPLAPHYLKALSAILECQNNVEHLKCATWLNVVDFCLQSIDKYLEDHDAEPSGSLSRSFSGLGTSRVSGPMAKSAAGNRNAQGQQSSLTKENSEELLRNLLFLVSATNAPLQERYQEVADTAIRFLQFQGSTVSQAQLLGFSIVNAVLGFTRRDRVSFSKSTAQAIVSPIIRFLQGKALLKDEMWNSVRDEISILLFTVHLHLESSCKDEDATELLPMLEDLSGVLRTEYSRRSEREQIQLHDLKMTDFGAEESDTIPFRLYPFQLRPHSIKAERDWANLQFIGVVERLVNLGSKKENALPTNPDDESDRHPNKRQKTNPVSDRIIDPLKSEDEKTRMAGLQILPFVLEDCQIMSSSLTDLLIQLLHCASDKRGNIASWALLAVAR